MKLVIKKEIKLNDYHVELDITEITNVEQELLNDFGKLKIDIGGDIPLTTTSGTSSFKLSNETKILPDDFAYTRIFKQVTYGDDAEQVALAYIEEMKSRIKVAVEALNAKMDVFSGLEEVQL